ncbi:TerC family protein [Marinicrinis sediminis]|uniref:TerC family protein n=1 Tax=Marinicrinis sediminis TaxID=1652465 RepID=A0ABW5RCC1_9BACL
MDLFSVEFWTALATIVFIDLILAGDNAIVIGLAAKNLPKHQQKKAVFYGTFGAIFIRALATIFVVYLLKIPFLQLAGGLLLIWIAYKLLVQEEEHDIQAGSSLFAAIRTIIIADAAMGVDNVIAVAGAAHGSIVLVVLGLLISIPIVVWGSTLFITLTDKYPFIIYIGSGILAYTAAKMITHDKKLVHFFEDNSYLTWLLVIIVVVGVLAGGKMVKERKRRQRKTEAH